MSYEMTEEEEKEALDTLELIRYDLYSLDRSSNIILKELVQLIRYLDQEGKI